MDITSLAQRKIKAGENRPTFSCRVGSQDVTGDIKDLSITYDSGGASEATLHPYSSLSGLENASVKVDVGYGAQQKNYFTGTLEHVEDTHWGDVMEGQAWGPFKLMAEQQLLEQVDYVGMTLEGALMDVVNRTGYPSGSTEIIAGRGYTIQGEAAFTLETTLQEAAEGLCNSANFIMSDRPYGRRLFMPRPRPGATAKAKAIYNEGHLPPSSFIVRGNKNSFYARVVVFRRMDDGSYAFPPVDVRVDVESKYKPAPNKAYILPEFTGDHGDAKDEGALLAQYLRRGTFGVEITGMAANPELLLHDTVDFQVTEYRYRTGRKKDVYEVTYKCVLDQGITMNVAREGNTMDLQMTGIKTREVLKPKVYPVSMAKSPAVV